MPAPKTTRLAETHPKRTVRIGCAIVALFAPLFCCTGCEDAVAAEFRSAAIDKVESGINDIVDGLLTGVFTVAEPSPGETGNDAATDGGGDGAAN